MPHGLHRLQALAVRLPVHKANMACVAIIVPSDLTKLRLEFQQCSAMIFSVYDGSVVALGC